MSRATNLLRLAVILLLAISTITCKQTPNGNGQASLGRCMEDLNTIPQLAALKGRKPEPPDSANSKPLEGMEIALTLNNMMRGEGDAKDIDNWCEHEGTRENVAKLVAALKQYQIPSTVAFIVGQTADPQLVRDWVAGGNRVGNRTYSLKKPNRSTADEFIDDVSRNEQTINTYQPATPDQAKYFRFPRQKVSLDPDARAKVGKYLSDNHYKIALATIDAHDVQFNWIYCSALSRSDDSCVQLLKAYFKSLLLDTTLKARESARQAAGHEIKQIMTLDASQFTCDFLGEILAWYKSLGARFISLDDALQDPFYTMVDDDGKPVAAGFSRDLKHKQTDGEK